MGLAEKFARIDAVALVESSFETFWSLYPRKVAKRAALKEWERELRAGTNPSDIITGLKAQLPAMLRKEMQFIPHARTWLHNARWEDEPETIPLNGRRRSMLDAVLDRTRH